MSRVTITVETNGNRKSSKIEYRPFAVNAHIINQTNPKQAQDHQNWCNNSTSWKKGAEI